MTLIPINNANVKDISSSDIAEKINNVFPVFRIFNSSLSNDLLSNVLECDLPYDEKKSAAVVCSSST